MLPRSIDTPDIRPALLRDFAFPVGLTTLMQLDAVPVAMPGVLVQCSCWVGASDSAAPDNVSSTIQEGVFRVTSANVLAPVTTNRLDKQVAGAAFAADVDFVVVPGAPVAGIAPLNLVANNSGAVAYVGDVVVRYWLNRGAW